MEKNIKSPLIISNKMRARISAVIVAIVKYVVLISIGYLVIYPLIYMLSFAFRPREDMVDPGVIWIPKGFSLGYLKNADKAIGFADAIKNSLLFEIVSAIIEVMTCAVAAYGMARFKFRGKKILTVLLFLIIILPDQMLIVPKMMNYSNLDFLGIIKLINSLGANIKISILDTGLAFWLPSLFGVGLKSGMIIFIYMQFFKGLPRELEEAAWIDGATLSQTYLKIALPSSSVVFTTVIILSVIWHWNDYYLAAMYTNANFPFAVKLAQISTNLQLQGIWGGDPAHRCICCIASLIFVLPVMVMYIILQRKFVQSIDRVGITG